MSGVSSANKVSYTLSNNDVKLNGDYTYAQLKADKSFEKALASVGLELTEERSTKAKTIKFSQGDTFEGLGKSQGPAVITLGNHDYFGADVTLRGGDKFGAHDVVDSGYVFSKNIVVGNDMHITKETTFDGNGKVVIPDATKVTSASENPYVFVSPFHHGKHVHLSTDTLANDKNWLDWEKSFFNSHKSEAKGKDYYKYLARDTEYNAEKKPNTD